jgi:ABC-type multidrug transport system fused ATPase/permease subunit
MDSGRSQSTNELLNGLYDNLEDLEQENPITLDLNKLSISKGLTPTPSATNSAVSSALSTPAKREKLTKFGLAWVNLTFSPNLFMSKNTKTILRNISGQIKFGTIVGLMGPSGCGQYFIFI